MAMTRTIDSDRNRFMDQRDQIFRTELYCSQTAGVPEAEYAPILAGFHRLISEVRSVIQLVDFGNMAFAQEGDFSSPEWYQNRATTKIDAGFGPQVSAVELDRLLRIEPFQRQRPHFDLMVIDRDLRTASNDFGNNFIFGYGPYPNNIISIRRFLRYIPDAPLRRLALSVLAAHELGHNFYLTRRNFNIGKNGYKFGHCNGESGPCLMEQVNVPETRDIQDQARIIAPRGRWLCPDCTEEIWLRSENVRSRIGFW